METQHLMDTYKYFHKESGTRCVGHPIITLIVIIEQWYVESLDMKELLPLTEDQEITIYTAMYYGTNFIVMEMKILYMTVTSAVVSFMKVIHVIIYPNMHVKVSSNLYTSKLCGVYIYIVQLVCHVYCIATYVRISFFIIWHCQTLGLDCTCQRHAICGQPD